MSLFSDSEDLWVLVLPFVIVGFGLFLMFGISPNDNSSVSIHSDTSVASTVEEGGKLAVQFTANRRRSCPGLVVHAFSQLGKDRSASSQVVVSYPAIEIEPGTYRRNLIVEMPPLVTPGKWRYTMALDSNCNGTRVIYQVVTTDIDVKAAP